MTKMTVDEIEQMVYATLDHACAPIGSKKFATTPEAMEPLIMKGDAGDGWVFVCGLVRTMIQTLSLDTMTCPCGDPKHEAKASFGFAIVDNLNPDAEPVMYFPEDGGEIPEHLAPEAVYLARIINAELNEDDARSADAWNDAVVAQLHVKLISLAAKQAGDVRRSALAHGSAN